MTTDRSLRLARSASRGLSTDGVRQIIAGYQGGRYAAVEPGWKPKPGMLYTQVRAISARINQNYDAWPSEELKKSYRTFLGKPVFVNHANEDPEKARGKVIAARYIESGDDKFVEVIQEVDATRFPKLAREIREGGLDSVSMGVEAGITKCSYCGNTATDEPEFCEHVRHHKGEYLPRRNPKTGKNENVLVYENCYKLGFFELSYVFEPADETAVVSRVVVANQRPRRRTAQPQVQRRGNALIVVDAQNDFVNGSLPVPGGEEAATRIGQALRGEHPHLNHNDYDQVISTQDWHIDPGNHFSDNPDYVDTWPVHCQAGTPGCDLHPALNGGRIDHQFRKGHYSAAYSGFEGQHAQTGGGLADHLRQHGINDVDVCGIATDHCVKATALDAAKNGFNTRVLLPFTAAVSDEGMHNALGELQNAGVQIVGHQPAGAKTSARWARRRYAYGEIEAPEDIDTLRDEDGDTFEDYQFVEPIGHDSEDDDHEQKFQHWLESPEELQDPDLGATKRLDREQEEEGLDSDRRVEDVEGIGQQSDEDEAMMAQQQGRQAMASRKRRRRVANDEAALIDQAVQELEQYEAEQGDEGQGDYGDYDGDGYSDEEDADDNEDGYPEDDDGYDDDGDGSDEDYSEDGGDEYGEPGGDEGVYGGEPGDESLDPRYDDPEAEQRMARRRYVAFCRQRGVRPTNAGYRRFVATVGRSVSARNRRGKGNAMGTLAGRGRVASRGRMRHFADDNGFVDGGPYGDNEDQGVQEEVYISQVPPSDSDDLPTTGDGTISNTENTLVARRMQKRIKAKAADLQRELRAYRKFAEDDNIIEPTEVNPDFSGTDDQEYKGDFESVQPDEVTTQPKDASLRVFRSFDNWLRNTTGRTASQHGNANFIRRQAASYAKAANIPLERMFPTLDRVLRQARNTEQARRAAMRRRADEKLEVAAPQDRIDVETPVADITDEEAQASQYDLGDFGNNAGDSIADPNLDTDSQIWAPGEGDSGTKSANRKADAVAAVRYAEAYINAGLPHRDKWQLVAQAQTMRHATVVDRTRVLEAVVESNTQRSRSRKVAAAVSRGTANGLPRGMTAPRTASTRTAANDPSNDIGMWL